MFGVLGWGTALGGLETIRAPFSRFSTLERRPTVASWPSPASHQPSGSAATAATPGGRERDALGCHWGYFSQSVGATIRRNRPSKRIEPVGSAPFAPYEGNAWRRRSPASRPRRPSCETSPRGAPRAGRRLRRPCRPSVTSRLGCSGATRRRSVGRMASSTSTTAREDARRAANAPEADPSFTGTVAWGLAMVVDPSANA